MNGRNPLVVSAGKIRLPMPYEDQIGSDYEYEDDEDWDEDMDDAMPEPLSEDERVNGVNRPVRDYSHVRPPRRKRRMPPMPSTPDPEREPRWKPPFEVLPDGTVTGPSLSRDGDPPIEELPEGFDPPKGSMAAVASIFAPPLRGR